MTTITLKAVPNDIHDHIMDVQTKIKKEKKTSQYSLEQTVYKMLREHKVKDSDEKKKQ